MMKTGMKRAVMVIVGCAAMCSCVSSKVYNSEKASRMRTEDALWAEQDRTARLSDSLATALRERDLLAGDTTRLGVANRDWQGRYGQLSGKYDKLLADGSAEASRMLKELQAREQRVGELEQTLRAREEALAAIRRQVADALLGFEGKGLTITQKDGKVYVSMEDKLLFRSGSWEVDPNGAKAVRELGTVLAHNADINVMVEGHTDDVPYKANGPVLDNLDLSTKRATTVTRLLLENKEIAPSRITAAGRGESLPVDPAKTTEARAKNRRTEIILTPKLDELMQLMDTK